MAAAARHPSAWPGQEPAGLLVVSPALGGIVMVKPGVAGPAEGEDGGYRFW